MMQSNLLTAPQEQSITQLHDVRLVHGGHLLPIILCRVIEGELGYPLAFLCRNDLQTLHNALDALVLERGILSLCLFTNYNAVDAAVP